MLYNLKKKKVNKTIIIYTIDATDTLVVIYIN